MITGDAIDYAASQEVADDFPQIPADVFARSVVYVAVDGSVHLGAEAVARSLAAGGRAWPLWLYRNVPGAGALADLAYRLVATNRVTASRWTRRLWGDDVRPPTYEAVRWLFLRGLGFVYLIAFLSLQVQVEGLIGSEGIAPLAPWLDAIADRYGDDRLRVAPTVFWLVSSDYALNAVCGLGVVASLLLVFNLLPAVAAAAAWGLYLSLFVAGRVFLGFQWDILLLESGVLGFLFAPWGLRPALARAAPAPRPVLWLLRLLLFKLMFLSGVVKLASNDPVWWNLTALAVHYQTQPLPTWTAWYIHQMPLWFHRACCAAMFFIELFVPPAIFAPRRPRLIAFALLVALQLVIIATGNYTFFNLLTIVLCIPLLDDACLLRALPAATASRWQAAIAENRRARRPAAGRLLIASSALVLGALSVGHLTGRLYGYSNLPGPIRSLISTAAPLKLSSSYGLFANMTTRRPEIVIEGSEDGRTWRPYEFVWKPGDPARRPGFVAPHQPRLDWQMWFAALGDYRRNPWLIALMRRLLEGSEPVLALLETDPFAGGPPRHIRATVWEYRFTDRAEREKSGAWWDRQNPRLYAPVLTRD